jgi:hypothetical protein
MFFVSQIFRKRLLNNDNNNNNINDIRNNIYFLINYNYITFIYRVIFFYKIYYNYINISKSVTIIIKDFYNIYFLFILLYKNINKCLIYFMLIK